MAYMAEDVTHPGLFSWAKLPETDSVWVQHSRGPHVHFIWVSKKAQLPPNVCFPFFFSIAGMLSNKTLITWTELCEKQIATLKLDGKHKWGTDDSPLVFPTGRLLQSQQVRSIKERRGRMPYLTVAETASKIVAFGRCENPNAEASESQTLHPGPGASTNYHNNNGAKFNQNQQKAGAQLTR